MHTLLLAAALGVTPLIAAAQQPDVRFEKTLAAGSTVSFHNISGDVTVTPSTSGKVEIVGVKRGRNRDREDLTLELVETAGGIVVCAMNARADMECDERGVRVHRDRRWSRDGDWDNGSIDIQAKVPVNLLVRAHSVSGDVDVVGAQGEVEAGSVSGNVRMVQLRAASVRASSVSGDVDVGIAALVGSGALKFHSVSGDVTAELPKGIDADVHMRSVSGDLDSDFPLTLNGRMSRHSLEAKIGKGGRLLEVRTVSGNVRLREAK